MILGVIKNGEKELLVGGAAANVSYNNGNSGLTATDVQGAVDELSADITKSVTFPTTNTALQLNTPFTADTDGYLRIYAHGGNIQFSIGSSLGGSTSCLIPEQVQTTTMMYIRKGITITMTNGQSGDLRFYSLG